MDAKMEAQPLLPSAANPTTRLSSGTMGGYVLVFAAAITMACRSIFYNLGGAFYGYPAKTSVFLTSVLFIIYSTIWITVCKLWHEFSVSRRALLQVCLRGICAAFTSFFAFTALAHIPAGNHMTIMALSPTISAVLALAFLSDPISLRDAAILLVNITGVIIVAQPTLQVGGDVMLGTLSAFGAAFFSSLGFIFVRSMGASVHYMLLVLSTGVFGLFIGVFMPPSEFAAITDNLKGTAIISIAATLSCTTSILVNKGMQIVRPGLGMVVRTFNVPTAVALGAIFLGEPVSILLVVGVILVVGSICAIGLSKHFKSRARRS